MTVKITGFSVISNSSVQCISYAFDILDDNGSISKSNIRRSLPLNADTTLSSAINTSSILGITESIKSYLVANTTI